MKRSLIYVSRRTLVTLDPETALADIVAVAQVRNKALNLTGSLACTREYFAQIVEGPSGAIDALMHDIEQDDRHTEITILRESAIVRRKLPEWSMAYSGASTYVTRQIEALLGEESPGNSYRIDRLSSLLVGFAKADTLIHSS